MRLDQHLSAIHPEKTRVHWQRMIKKGLIKVEGLVVLKPKFEVSQDSKIEFDPECLEVSKILPENIPLDIIYEDHELIVINKPSGMVVHPAYGHNSGTLVNALLYHCKDLSGIGGVARPGIVHRLDKDTSGLIVIAKNDTSHNFLAQQFHPDTKQATRIYKAIVHGVPQKMEDKISIPIEKDPKRFDRMRVCAHKNAKPAITHYKVLKTYGNTTKSLWERYSLIECELLTGRTHQIRVHMSHLKHPIVGDTLYGSTNKDSRLLLHASELSFIHPQTKERTYFKKDINYSQIFEVQCTV